MLLQDRHTPRWNTEREQLAARKMQQFPRRRQISKDVHGCIDYLQTWLDCCMLVAAELGVALVLASLQNLQRAGVVYKPLEDQTLYVKLAIVWRSANTSPVLHQFLAQSRAVTRFSTAFH